MHDYKFKIKRNEILIYKRTKDSFIYLTLGFRRLSIHLRISVQSRNAKQMSTNSMELTYYDTSEIINIIKKILR